MTNLSGHIFVTEYNLDKRHGKYTIYYHNGVKYNKLYDDDKEIASASINKD